MAGTNVLHRGFPCGPVDNLHVASGLCLTFGLAMLVVTLFCGLLTTARGANVPVCVDGAAFATLGVVAVIAAVILAAMGVTRTCAESAGGRSLRDDYFVTGAFAFLVLPIPFAVAPAVYFILAARAVLKAAAAEVNLEDGDHDSINVPDKTDTTPKVERCQEPISEHSAAEMS